jgi:hypothetical protein
MIRNVAVFGSFALVGPEPRGFTSIAGHQVLEPPGVAGIVLEYSVVCRARPSTQTKAYISRARVSSLVYFSSPASDKSEVFFTVRVAGHPCSEDDLDCFPNAIDFLSYHRRSPVADSIASWRAWRMARLQALRRLRESLFGDSYLFIPDYRTGHSPADSQGIGHLYSKLSFMRRAEL